MYRGYAGRYGSGNVFTKRRRMRFGWVLAAVLLAALVICTGYTAIDNGHVQVRKQRVFCADLPQALEGFTVLHVSDLGGKRFGAGASELMRSLKNESWDAVVCTGNMLGEEGDAYAFYELIEAVGTQKPFFFLAGRSDPTPVGRDAGFYTVVSDWVMGAQSRNAVYVDRPYSFEVDGETVWVSEPSLLTLDLEDTLNAYTASGTALGAYWASVVSETIAARKSMETDCGLHLLLSAEPLDDASVRKLLESVDGDFVRTVDLVLAGGTAAGQWKIPGVGGVWALGEWFPKGQLDGYGYAGSLLQYVSGGLGVDPQSPLPAFRLLNSPEVTLLTFTNQTDLDTLPVGA